MEKQRVTLRLDPEVVAALKRRAEGQGVSATANEVLCHALGLFDEAEAHRRALAAWLDELDEKYGRPTAEHYARADEFVDELFGRGGDEVSQTAGESSS